jgi:hypothetical protein
VYINSSNVAVASPAVLAFDGTNLGLGVTPSAWISSFKGFDLSTAGAISGSGSGTILWANCYLNTSTQIIRKTTGYTVRYVAAADVGQHIWINGAYAASGGGVVTETQAMTLDASNNLLLGTTSTSVTSGGIYNRVINASGSSIIIGHQSGVATGNSFAEFQYAGSLIGYISQVGTTSVLYNTTSDYRLKSNVVPVTTGLSVINQLNPVNFTWISDNESDTGFLAHEFQTVIPRAVTGTKDATIEEEYEVTPAVKDEQENITTPAVMGTRTIPVYQQMDNSGAVPYLVAAIKELSAQVTALQAKVGV